MGGIKNCTFLKFLVFICTLNMMSSVAFGQTNDIRRPAKAGQFYPSDPEVLSNTIKRYLDNSEIVNIEGPITGLLEPHAGYEFCGQVAASGYRQIEGSSYDVVVIMGTCHYKGITGGALGDWDAYDTPLGSLKVDKKLVNEIVSMSSLLFVDRSAHLYEHSIEVQLPFIQTVLPGVPIVPIVMGRLSYGQAKEIAKAIIKSVKSKKVLFIASSDMSHYPSYRDAYEVDLKTLDQIKKGDPKGLLRLNNDVMRRGIRNLDCTLCGLGTVVTLMIISKEIGADKVHILPYMNSGDITGERNRVVGYGSAVFYKEVRDKREKTKRSEGDGMSEQIKFSNLEKKKLFQIARKSIMAALKKRAIPHFDVLEENLLLKRGVFVTLMNHGRLRGCIGHFGADMPLWKIVSQMAVAAATQDYRFTYNPVTSKEMDEIDVKISILSPLKRIKSIDEIKTGIHGIWIKQGVRSGTYLPEVATEMGWNRREFVEHCAKEKAGLAADAWKKGAEMYIYTSQILSEKDVK